MYVIKALLVGDSYPRLLAAYELINGQIVFDDTRGDAEFIARLRSIGVPLMTSRGTLYVTAKEGHKFHDACRRAFSSPSLFCCNEETLNFLDAQFPVIKQSKPPPAAVA
jgi:hypothetical protein